MRPGPRKTAMKVRDGSVQRKNRTALTPHYVTHAMSRCVLDRRPPGPGYRHLVTLDQLRAFLAILPEWETISQGLDAIVLAPGSVEQLGGYDRGVVEVNAWERALIWPTCRLDFLEEHHALFTKLGIPHELRAGSPVAFTEKTARAFQLVHVLVHELGHHHDRMTTRSRRAAARGEDYAEAYAQRHEDEILGRYEQVFG